MKARHLILAIHDYYLQKLDDQQHDSQLRRDEYTARCINEEDVWTLDYLDLMHLQPILEAFDDDVSGFVTIQEVNHFTTSRPQGWRYAHYRLWVKPANPCLQSAALACLLGDW